MRLLARNKQLIKYKTFTSKQAIVDSDGFETGEFRMTYSTLKETRAFVGARQGNAYKDVFGTNLNYDRVILATNNCDIDENSILWLEQTDATKPYDYIVVRVSQSLNVKQIAAKKVK